MDIVKQNFLGVSDLCWFIGVVENRLDPLSLGRCQVRIWGWHTADKTLIPTSDLKWAQPILPLSDPDATVKVKEAQWVIGWFLDGIDAQHPIIVGQLPGIPESTPPDTTGFSDPRSQNQIEAGPVRVASHTFNTDGTGVETTNAIATRYPVVLNEASTSRVARNQNISDTMIGVRKDNLVTGTKTANNISWSEPETKYNAQFPYNRVIDSESGHLIEVDDTPGAERLSRAHRTGTFEEIHPDGSRVLKVVKDDYEIYMGENDILVMGTKNETVNKDKNLYVQGNINVIIQGNQNMTIQGDSTWQINGNWKVNVQGDTTLTSEGETDINGNPVDLNPGG